MVPPCLFPLLFLKQLSTSLVNTRIFKIQLNFFEESMMFPICHLKAHEHNQVGCEFWPSDITWMEHNFSSCLTIDIYENGCCIPTYYHFTKMKAKQSRCEFCHLTVVMSFGDVSVKLWLRQTRLHSLGFTCCWWEKWTLKHTSVWLKNTKN